VGVHIRAGDGFTDYRLSDDVSEFRDCILNTISSVTSERCKDTCPWTGVKIFASADRIGGEMIREMFEDDNTTSVVIGTDRRRVPLKVVDLSDMRGNGYVHVGDIKDDVGFEQSLETLTEMLAVGSGEMMIRGESGFNFIAQMFGGIDSSFTATVAEVDKRTNRLNVCSFQKLFSILKKPYCAPRVTEDDDDNEYQEC